jgi:selenium metabolism protein YedF
MKTVDTKGQLCPAPLIATKRELKATKVGESFIILTDNQTSFNNVSRFLKDNKTDFQVSETKGVWTLTITKTAVELSHPDAEKYCAPPVSHFEKGNFVIVFSSDKMGEGDDDLGHLLISNFIKALKDLDRLPHSILFYNNGVKLVTSTSPVIDNLKDLDKMGVQLHICATCVNHYKLESIIGAGTLSNMYSIAEIMASAGSVIKP